MIIRQVLLLRFLLRGKEKQKRRQPVEKVAAFFTLVSIRDSP